MLVWPSSVIDFANEGRFNTRGLMRFDFGTGQYGFSKGIEGNFVYGGVTYVPGGIIGVSPISTEAGLSATAFEVTLASSNYDELTPEVLKTIEAEDYRDRPVTIYNAHFNPDTGELLAVQAMRRGYVDVIDHKIDRQNGYTLIAHCETRELDYTRRNDRYRTVEDQARRAPGDLCYEHTGIQGRQEIYWARYKTLAPPTNVSVGKGFRAGITNV